MALIDFESKSFFEISKNDFEVNTHTFDPTEKKLYYSGQSLSNMKHKNHQLNVFDLQQNETKTLLEQSNFDIKKILFQDSKIFILASDYKKYGFVELPHLYQVDFKEVQLIQNLDLDFIVAENRGNHHSLLVLNHYETDLYTLNDNKILPKNFPFKGMITELSENQEIGYFIGNEKDKLPEIFKFYHTDLTLHQVTTIHNVFHEQRIISKNHLFEESSIDTWVIPPVDFKETEKYPAILYIHGGPHAAFTNSFDFNAQLFSSAGYYVIYANPRGSSGKGNEFAELREKTGISDFEDLEEILNKILDVHPNIDENRLGVTGISYGGYLTNWLIGHDNRFKVAISENGVSNWISQSLTSDIGFDYVQHYSGDPLVDYDIPWNLSPLKYAREIQASVLFIQIWIIVAL